MHSMKHFKRIFLMSTVFVAMALVVAACGGSGSGSSGGSYGYGGSGSTAPTAKATSGSSSSSTPASSSGAMIKTASATVKGQSVTLLTDAQGRTLYYFTADTPTTSACTGTCGQTWPPLLATGSASPTSATTLTGNLTMQTTGNGKQIEYNGHLLYTYSGDTGPAQTNGEGLFGKWFVATSDLATGNGSAGSNSNSNSGSSYGSNSGY